MKIGIAGNGGIVMTVIPAFKKDNIPMTALWCRKRERGEKAAALAGIENIYTDYDAFLQDDSFDTVYIGLVNSSHYEYAKRAMLKGKNVIVEKPFTSTYREAADLVRTAEEKNVFLFEAVLSRYSKNYDSLSTYLEQLGELKLIQANYSQYSRRYDAYEKGEVLPAFDPSLSGGALYDINVYNVHFVTGMFGAPKFAYYMANIGFNGIDTSGTLMMDYGQFKAVLTGAKDSAGRPYTILQGTKGTLTVHDRGGIIRHVTLLDRAGGEEKELPMENEDDPYAMEFARMQEVIDKKDHVTEQIWLNRSLQVIMILENARGDAGIVFSADDAQLI